MLGYLPIVPLVVAGVGVWFAGPALFALAIEASVLWSAILFFFLAGVRRGLSFFTEGGPQPAQILTMFWLFLVGVVVLISPYITFALAVAALGFASIGVLDPAAARRREVPDFFRALRPPQMGLATLAMISILLSVWL
ncbi:DUF3429 domain-containing protein [Salinisphaera sp.]|uniref:DUF3429 domain-containing protein n=1 Tax=Salinisphaera sp. TaxID=1914330 RepID=UPI0039C8DCB4